MKACKCGQPVEAERYEFCYDCWWKQDLRHPDNADKLAAKLAESVRNAIIRQFTEPVKLTAKDVVKHILYARGMTVNDKDEILNARNQVIAWIGDAEFNDSGIAYKLKLNTPIEFIPITITLDGITSTEEIK